jgi:small subunit ribosomal protein S16
MVKIRLKRTGKKNAPCYRVVVADSRSPRDGKIIETVGLYDPCNSNESLKMDRIDYWLSNGAQPTETAADIIRRVKTGAATCGYKGKKKPEDAAAVADAAKEEAAETAEG